MSAAPAARPRRVERIEDWDRARYAVTPPRAALDMRLTAIHFRLIMLIGRINAQGGWCELSQTAVAAQIDCNRGSVNRSIGELVAWHYLEKRGQETTGSARCHYRILIDKPEEVEAEPAAVPDDEETCHVAGDTPPPETCHVAGDTGVTHHVTDVSPHKDTPLDQRSKVKDPKPRRAGLEEPVDELGKDQIGPRNAALIASLVAWGRHRHVVDHLLRPMLAEKRFSASDAEASLKALAGRCAGFSSPKLTKVLEIVRAGPQTIKEARLAEAIEAVKAAGLMLVIDRYGQPEQWAAWRRHFAGQWPRAMLAKFDQADRWQVPDAWPSATHQTGPAAVGEAGAGGQQ